VFFLSFFSSRNLSPIKKGLVMTTATGGKMMKRDRLHPSKGDDKAFSLGLSYASEPKLLFSLEWGETRARARPCPEMSESLW
jgi:hypothetical protein